MNLLSIYLQLTAEYFYFMLDASHLNYKIYKDLYLNNISFPVSLYLMDSVFLRLLIFNQEKVFTAFFLMQMFVKNNSNED